MSLFPAYSKDGISQSANVVQDSEIKNDTNTDWLTNSSFCKTPANASLEILSESSTEESESVPQSKHSDIHLGETLTCSYERKDTAYKRKIKYIKKRKREKRRHINDASDISSKYEKDVVNLYFEDKYRDKGNNNVDTLCSRVRPLYDHTKIYLDAVLSKNSKKETFKRYYVVDSKMAKKMGKKSSIISREKTETTTANEEESVFDWCTNLEEEQKCKTRDYNERLTKSPDDVSLWIEYIEFQDILAKFQNYWLTVEDNARTILVKKLSIVEKALEKNADSRILLKLKLRLMSELHPADQFSNEMQVLVNKDTGNIILWKVFIMVTQGSLAMCTVPRVLELYSKCFCTLRQRSRTNPQVFDDHLLEMLYQCLIFIRHTGLWEQMWETIRLNLSLNLNLNKNTLSFHGSIDEKKLIGMEEVILLSRLPLNQLWLRTESLRENCHWISVGKDELELVGDSRRFILPEDVADFVHPIISSDSNFRMAVYFLLALKVPLLPVRSYVLKDFILTDFEWGIDSSEMLLPFAYPTAGEMVGHNEKRELIASILTGRLTSGPQYLQFHPAQEPYLDFIREIFHTIAEGMNLSQRTSIYVWWLRFERLLIFLNKRDTTRCDNKGKKIRGKLKEFLKQTENRNNLHFYREYALIEREMGRFDNCVNILETAIQSQTSYPSEITDLEERAALFSLYRTYIEILLGTEDYKESHKNRIQSIFSRMVHESSQNEILAPAQYLQDCIQEFLSEVPTDSPRDKLFLPNLDCDKIVCCAYFLYLRDNDIDNVVNIFSNCIEHSKECPRLQEMLYESEISILHLHNNRMQNIEYLFRSKLKEALNLYADNFYLLSIFANIESNLPTWKLNTVNAKSHLWKAMAVCLAVRRRIEFLAQHGDIDAAQAAVNKLLSFYRTLARTPAIRTCPLMWRMYMLLLREQNLCEKHGEEVYHQSVTQCPWARSIYIDAAEIAPQLLTQVQDVIREKELRMHVTPEELDILRG